MKKSFLLHGSLAVAIALSTASLGVTAQETESVGDGVTRTPGPTGTPGTTGQGGSADTVGTQTPASHVSGVTVEEFVEKGTAKSAAVIEMNELALEEGSDQVRELAERAAEEQRDINARLRSKAVTLDLTISDNPGLMDQGKAWLLEWRDGESFDLRYAEHMVTLYQELTHLFESAAHSDHGELSQFAEESLPKLRETLEQAEELVKQLEQDA